MNPSLPSISTRNIERDERGRFQAPLRKWDLKVLAALPASPAYDEPWDKLEYLNEWQIAHAVREDDVAYVRATLRGLADRHLVWPSADWRDEKRRWMRTIAGNEYLEAHR